MFSLDKVSAVAILLGFALFIIGTEIATRTPDYYRTPRSALFLKLGGVLLIGGGLYEIIAIS